MRTLALVLAASLVTTSACASAYPKSAMAVGTGFTALGTVLLVTSERDQPSENSMGPDIDVGYGIQNIGGVALLAVGLAIFVSGVRGATAPARPAPAKLAGDRVVVVP